MGPKSESFEVFDLCNFFCLEAFMRSKTWGSLAVHWVKCHSCRAKMPIKFKLKVD